jgi:hypothetical protein
MEALIWLDLGPCSFVLSASTTLSGCHTFFFPPLVIICKFLIFAQYLRKCMMNQSWLLKYYVTQIYINCLHSYIHHALISTFLSSSFSFAFLMTRIISDRMSNIHRRASIAHYSTLNIISGITKVLTRYQYDTTRVSISVSSSQFSSKIVVLSIPTVMVDAYAGVHIMGYRLIWR